MGNEQEFKNENNKRELKRSKTKANFDDNNNEKKTAKEYDNEMSRILFDDEFKEENQQEKSQGENKKIDKKTEFKNYAKEIEEEKYMEEINRSKSCNKINFDAHEKKKCFNKIDLFENKNIYLINNDIRENKKNKLNGNEKTKSKSKMNFLKRLFTPNKKIIKCREENKTNNKTTQNINTINVNNKKAISSRNQIQIKKNYVKEEEGENTNNDKARTNKRPILRQLSSKDINNNGYISEGNIPKSSLKDTTSDKKVLSKDIYKDIKSEDLKVVVLHMKNSDIKYKEGLDLFENKQYREAKNCFNQARASYMNLNKIINNNPTAYPNKFKVVISMKVNEKMRLTLNLIKDCNSFMFKNPEKTSKSQEKSFKKLNFNNIVHNNNKKNIDFNLEQNKCSTHRNFNVNNRNKKQKGYLDKNNKNIFNKTTEFKFNYKKVNIDKIENKNCNSNNKNNFKEINRKEYNKNIFNNKLQLINFKNNINANNIDEIISSEIKMNPKIKFSDIIGMKEVKKKLDEIIELQDGEQKNIILFGPKGIGKEMTIKAIASEYKYILFNINFPHIIYKYWEKCSEIINSVFRLAESESKSIIFLDEIDSICCKNIENETKVIKNLKTELITQLEKVRNNKNKLLIIISTNKPMNIDKDLLKYYNKTIYCAPLNDEEKYTFIKNTINKVENSLSDEDIKEVVTLTKSYSNEELEELCKMAAFQPGKELSFEEVSKIEKLRPIIKNDFIKAMKLIKGSINDNEINEILMWNGKLND